MVIQLSELENRFSQIRQHPDYIDIFDGRDVAVYAIVDDIEDGYKLSAFLSRRAHAAHLLDPLSRGLIGDSSRAVMSGNPVRDSSIYVYPEHELTAKQQQEFVYRLMQTSVKQVTIITTSPIILSDFAHFHIALIGHVEYE